MRKTTKNEKVIRAITIELATMITVSTSPITVLAEENTDSDNDTNTSESEGSSEETTSEESSASESQSEETSTVAEAESVCESAEAIIEGTSEDADASAISLPETIEDAADAVAAVGPGRSNIQDPPDQGIDGQIFKQVKTILIKGFQSFLSNRWARNRFHTICNFIMQLQKAILDFCHYSYCYVVSYLST